ncbi:MAG: metallophosphoesterase [Acutalibacteraceae bacterium]
MQKKVRSVLAAILAAMLVFASFSAAFAAEEKAPLQVGVVSDIHYFSEKCTGNWCDAFMKYAESTAKERYETPALLDSALTALAEHAKENGMKYVFIPGDLTPNGEYDNHVELAQRLEQFEKDTGMSVIVINGNHDINNYRGITFENGKKESARITTPEDFLDIYQNLGYDLAYHTYSPSKGQAGRMSYSVKLDGGYRLIVLDTNKYTADATADGEDVQETAGNITDELMAWALEEIQDAIRDGETPIGMEHHGIVQHFELQNTIFQAFLVDDWQERAEAFADAGLSMMFTGHMHDISITDWVSDNGNVLYDVCTPSLTGYPNYFREVLFDNTGDHLTADVRALDVDCVQPVTVRGQTIEPPFRETYSFRKSFSSDSITDLVMSFLSDTLDSLFDAMEQEGSLVGALQSQFGLDVEALISDYIDVRLGCIEIFTAKNVMSFIADLDEQLCTKVLQDKEHTEALVRDIVQQCLDLPVSDLPCTKYIDTYGFGDPSKPGTLEDAARCALLMLFGGNQNLEEDPFMADVLDYFENRQGANDLFDFLYDLLLNDLLQDTLLGSLDFNIDTLFPSGTLGHCTFSMLDTFLTLIFRGDKSYTNVINSILGLGLIEDFDSINGIADHFIGEYLTQSQLDSIGHTVSYMVGSMITEHGDGEDRDRFLTTEKKEVVVSRDNYRLPSIVTVTVGEDAATQRNISWYTKFSVSGSDIELVPYSETPTFSGTPTTTGVTALTERHDRTFPGVDLGIVGFMPTKQPLNRHTVSLTGLTPGTKYCYRVGDASRNWWSKAGVIETADNSDTVTFLHTTDPQSQNAKQYERFHTVLKTAFSMYPDTELVVSTGDQVDNGTNVNQWKWLMDVSSDVLMRTVYMPTTGNHEKKGAALDENFILPNVPEQDTDSGVYYDYDYNNVHFMVLNTNDATSKEGLSETQLNWLRDSANGSDAQWKIVVLHKATYSNGSHYDDKEVVAMRKQFKRLFPELGIDMVLEGHDHVYLRTDSMYNNHVYRSKTETLTYNGRDYSAKLDPYGTFYVISGCAGVKNYAVKDVKQTDKLFPRAEKLVDTMQSVFSAIQVKGNTLYFDAYTVSEDGTAERIDSFAIEKTGKQCPLLPHNDEILATAEDLDMDTAPAVFAATAEGFNDFDLYSDEDPVIIGGGTTKPDNGSGDTGSDNTGSGDAGSGNTGSGNTGSGSQSGAASGGTDAQSPADTQDANGSAGVTTPSTSTGTSSGSAAQGGTASGGSVQTSGSTGTAGTTQSAAQDADGAETAVLYSFGSNGKVPKLGGETPVVTACVLFGAMLVGMLAYNRKKDNE